MPTNKNAKNSTEDKLEQILVQLQNLFILEALKSGMRV